MMFTSDPCFNEPGYEGIRGTDEGDVSDNRVFKKLKQPRRRRRQYNATNLHFTNEKTVVLHALHVQFSFLYTSLPFSSLLR